MAGAAALGAVAMPVLPMTTAFAQTAQPVVSYIDEEAHGKGEAYRASVGRIVFHYGTGMSGIRGDITPLRQDGYDAIALAGGTPNSVQIFVDKGNVGKFSQQDVYSGQAAGMASIFYERRVGQPKPGLVTASLN